MSAVSRRLSIFRKLINMKKKSSPCGRIHESVQKCDVIALVRQLRRGADVNAFNGQGMTPLHVACETGNADLALILLRFGADVHLASDGDKGGVPAIVVAATHGHGRCLQVLLEHGAAPDACDEWGNTALFKASTYNHVNCVKVLLRYGATPNAANQWGATALQYAVLQGYTDVVRLLMSFGADPNIRGELSYKSPVQAAVRDHPHCLDLLVGGGVNLNVQMPSGVDLLTHVIGEGNDIGNDCFSARLLIENGAEINHGFISALSQRCVKKLQARDFEFGSQDSVKLGKDLYNLLVTVMTSLPVGSSREPMMQRTMLHLCQVLHFHKAFDCAALLIKMGHVSILDLPRSLAEDVGIMKHTDSLLSSAIVTIQRNIKDFSRIDELPLPILLKNYLTSC